MKGLCDKKMEQFLAKMEPGRHMETDNDLPPGLGKFWKSQRKARLEELWSRGPPPSSSFHLVKYQGFEGRHMFLLPSHSY